MVRCKSHCKSCGAHFDSDDAFDAHRYGPYDGVRRCRDIHKVKKFEIIEGKCEIDRTDGAVIEIARLK